MEKKVVGIDRLYGEAWSDAVLNVIDILNKNLGLELTWVRNGNNIDAICEALGIRFDEDGNIIK